MIYTNDYGMLHVLPTDIASLCQDVQNNLLHIFWADRYGRSLSKPDQQTVNIQSMRQKLALIHNVDANSLIYPRELEVKLVGSDYFFLGTSLEKNRPIQLTNFQE